MYKYALSLLLVCSTIFADSTVQSNTQTRQRIFQISHYEKEGKLFKEVAIKDIDGAIVVKLVEFPNVKNASTTWPKVQISWSKDLPEKEVIALLAFLTEFEEGYIRESRLNDNPNFEKTILNVTRTTTQTFNEQKPATESKKTA